VELTEGTEVKTTVEALPAVHTPAAPRSMAVPGSTALGGAVAALPPDNTMVRLLCGACSLVNSEAEVLVEAFLKLPTLEGPLACMCSHVEARWECLIKPFSWHL
jgi:hypothetical protein